MPLTLDNHVGKYVIREYDDDELITDYKIDVDALSINELGLSLTKPLNRLLREGLIAYVVSNGKTYIKLTDVIR
jgi:hypothetical protein